MKLAAIYHCELEITHKPLFSLGHIYSTNTVLKSLGEDYLLIGTLLSDHVQGNWGGLDKEEQIRNFEAIRRSERIISKFYVRESYIYVITEHDRSKTTLLLSGEY